MLSEVSFLLPKEEPTGATFALGSRFNLKQKKLRESKTKLPPETESSFNDTFLDTPTFRAKRLREGMNAASPGQFSRGVPTNDKTSSRNYDNDSLIDGEHKTLTILGKINEAMEGDDHDTHIYKHRLQLSDPKLSENRRVQLMNHIESHVKAKGKQLKAIDAANGGEKNGKGRLPMKGYGHGVGLMAQSMPAKTMSVIPQDDSQSAVRKRTAGMVSMEAEARVKRFDQAMRNRRRRGL